MPACPSPTGSARPSRAPARPFPPRFVVRRPRPSSSPAPTVIIPSAAAAAAATTPTWIPYLSLTAGTYCAALAILMAAAPGARLTRTLAGAPPRPSATTRAFRGRPHFLPELSLLPPAAAYLALLAASWTPDNLSVLLPGSLAAGLTAGWHPQFFPRLSGVASLFARPATAASLAVHLAAVGLMAARAAYLSGLEEADGRRRRTGGAVVDAGSRNPFAAGEWVKAAAGRLAQAVTVLLLAFVGPLGLVVQAGVGVVRRMGGRRRGS